MATSSPIEVRTITSATLSKSHMCLGNEHTCILFFLTEKFSDLVTDFALGNLDIVFGVAIIGHQRQEAVISDIELHHINKESPSCFGRHQ